MLVGAQGLEPLRRWLRVTRALPVEQIPDKLVSRIVCLKRPGWSVNDSLTTSYRGDGDDRLLAE